MEMVFKYIEQSANDGESKTNFVGVFDYIDVNSNKLGATVANIRLVFRKFLYADTAFCVKKYAPMAVLLIFHRKAFFIIFFY